MQSRNNGIYGEVKEFDYEEMLREIKSGSTFEIATSKNELDQFRNRVGKKVCANGSKRKTRRRKVVV